MLERARKAIVVADMVESVRLMQAAEDRVIRDWRRFVEDVTHELLPGRGGRLVKSLGDGLLLEFDQASEAVAATFWLHERMARLESAALAGERIELRCALHVCDRVGDEHDIYGAGVNLTARLASLAEPGGTVVSEAARDELVAGLDGELVDLGPCYLKHLPEPVRAFKLTARNAPVLAWEMPLAAHAELRALIAVLPFELRGASETGDDRVIGQWIAEGTIILLSKVPVLRVVSRLSSAAFEGRASPVSEVGQRLGADYVLSGSYAVSGAGVLLAAELAHARSGEVVWADRIASSVADLLAPQSEALGRIVGETQRAVVQAETERSRLKTPPNLQSFALQIGSVSLMHRSAADDFERAHALLSHLVERHPRMAAPRAWLALWYVLRVTRGQVAEPASEAAIALDHVRRARDADPECSLALAMQGFVEIHMLRDPQRAEQTLEQALAVNPSDSLAWLFKGVVHSLLGKGDSALEMVEQARRLSPLDPMGHYYDALAAPAALAAGQPARAAAYALRSLRANRQHSPTWRALVIAQSELGQLDKARASLEQLLALEPGLTVQRYLERSPAGANQTRRRYADALHRAGLPLH